MRPDALTTVLDDLRLSAGCYSRSEFRVPWGFAIAARPFAHYHFAIRGAALFRCGSESVWLRPGDLMLVPRGDAHSLSDSEASTLTPFEQLKTVAVGHDALRLRHGGKNGKQTIIICGTGVFEGRATHPIIDLLPVTLLVRGDGHERDSSIRTAIEMIGHEASALQPGAHAVINHLAAVIVIHAIRRWLNTDPGAREGWVQALKDQHLGKAIVSIHRKPERSWTVNSLAAEAHLSRSVFYERFTSTVGISPGEYLARHRMHVAASLLRQTGISVREVAESTGYGSEAAFSRAFKRHYEVSPGAFRIQVDQS